MNVLSSKNWNWPFCDLDLVSISDKGEGVQEMVVSKDRIGEKE